MIRRLARFRFSVLACSLIGLSCSRTGLDQSSRSELVAAPASMQSVEAQPDPRATQSRSPINLESLLQEMTDLEGLSRYPAQEYKSLQASSYNRSSKQPQPPLWLDTPAGAEPKDSWVVIDEGWYADSDGLAFVRQEKNGDRDEWVIMEHEGPGVITRMWTPFFYYGFGDRVGPTLRVYLDGAKEPVIEESFIKLLTGESELGGPFARLTARAGLFFLPIAFAKSAKLTLDQKAFYHIVNYRAYPEGTSIQTFSMEEYRKSEKQDLQSFAEQLSADPLAQARQAKHTIQNKKVDLQALPPGESAKLSLTSGKQAIRRLRVSIGPETIPERLRTTVLSIRFDGKERVWVPVGDFFCSPNQVNPFQTLGRKTQGQDMVSTFVMPYQESAEVELWNYGPSPVQVKLEVETSEYDWDERSMYFHASWNYAGPIPGNNLRDLNFIDAQGKGRLVADNLLTLWALDGWWGEGDEKIYINETDIQRNFPTHFGTGTEDYYGWAGGEVPIGEDVFSTPIASNVVVGSKQSGQDHTRGWNINTRVRLLDDVLFQDRLKFDMEASSGARGPHHFVDYSLVSFWYAFDGARWNHHQNPEAAAESFKTVADMQALQEQAKHQGVDRAAIEKRLQTKIRASKN